ncbi:MAG: CHAT domain-containing protein [Chloroflexi bacterium]|nr:CHAT domain-containing protein [Chloroflexota bacterium]
MIEELDRFVRWRRLPGYWLSFLFQLSMEQCRSPYFVVACRLYGDAQINLNADLSLSSLENGYNFLVQWLAIDDNEQMRRVADDLRRRMRLVYAYYRQWYTARPYGEINPLTEHLYSEKTFIDLTIAFPELDKPLTRLVPDDYLRVIDQCGKPEDIYCRVVSRRFLGSLYQGQNELDAAQEQFRLGLKEAQGVSLDTEIGHFHRLYGYVLSQIGQLEEAAQQFEKAFVHESHPSFSYWQALSARELGDIRVKMALREPLREVDPAHPPMELKPALPAYRAGRLMFEAHIGMSVVPVARGVKQQMFRSYTDNALQAAILLHSHQDTLAELEAAGPRYATEIVAEGRAASTLPVDVYGQFRKARAVFYRDLTAFNEKGSLNEDFSKYLASVEENRSARRLYMVNRNKLTPAITQAQLSDKIAQKVLALRLPNVVFLLIHVGQGQTVASLLDAGSGQMVTGIVKYGEVHWRQHHEAYRKAVQAAKGLPNPAVGMRLALDDLLGFYEASLSPFLEGLLPFLEGRHLKIFPRLFMNEVPFHALTVSGKRLIEYCQVSYAQTLGLFLQVHQHEATPSVRTLAMIYDEKGAPLYEGTLQILNNAYSNDLRVLRNPPWQEFASTIRGQCPTDVLFACHGQYDPDDPAASYLRFGGPQGVPFFKMFSELDLTGCKCVTLGACESGLGRTIITAECLSLPIAFFAAGVRHVISSLWQVNQLTAAILLSIYYKLLRDGQHTVTSALNEAQRDIMQMPRDQVLAWIKTNLPDRLKRWEPIIRQMENPPFAHPYYWAGFYVAGDV